MSLTGLERGLIVDLSCSLKPLSPTIDWPLLLYNRAVTGDDDDDDEPKPVGKFLGIASFTLKAVHPRNHVNTVN